MDGLAETVENVGLAQEIQKGLASSLQKPPNFKAWQAEIDAKKAELDGMGAEAAYSIRLIELLYNEWCRDQGIKERTLATFKQNFEQFKTTGNHWGLAPKYLICADKIALETPSAKAFEEMRPLGKGAFGAVFLVFNKATAQPFAVKKTVKAIAKQNKMIKDILIEREVLSKMTSPFCVNLHYAYKDADVVYLVITLCAGGDLAFLLNSRYSEAKKKEDRKFEHFPQSVVKFYAASMACGLQAIHDAGYVYRDLKPQNVLLDSSGQVRISDMGLTANVTGGAIKQCSGTRGFWSPETIEKKPYKFEPDWWSLGVTIYCLWSDKLPFKGKSDEEKDAATVAAVIEYGHDEPEDLQKVVSDLCTKDQTKRLGCKNGLEDLKGHPYFAGFDWVQLINGDMPAEIVPNPNDINAPGKSEIAAFKKPKDVDWTPEDEKAFDDWDTFDKRLWYNEAIGRMKNRKEISREGGGGGGGGCCTIA